MEKTEKYPNWFLKARGSVYLILSIIEGLLAFRFLFKLLGANPKNGVVVFIYAVTGILSAPFSGIFRTVVNGGIETSAVMEPATIIAMIVYALIARAIVSILKLQINENTNRQ